MTKLYHTEIGLPENLLAPLLGKSYKLNYSRHAINEMLSDKYGPPRRMPIDLFVHRADVFEVEITDGWIGKFCVRLPFGSRLFQIEGHYKLDLILVLVPRPDGLFVKTLWFNDSADNHATLDRSKYATV